MTNHQLNEPFSTQSLELFVNEIIGEGKEPRSLIYFIQRRLRQFRLDQDFTLFDVINEVFVRYISAVKNSAIINKLSAWMKSAASKYIEELSRRHTREFSCTLIESKRKKRQIDDELAEIERLEKEQSFINFIKNEEKGEQMIKYKEQVILMLVNLLLNALPGIYREEAKYYFWEEVDKDNMLIEAWNYFYGGVVYRLRKCLFRIIGIKASIWN